MRQFNEQVYPTFLYLIWFKVHLYQSESDVAPDALIENAIECLHQGTTKIIRENYFRFSSRIKEPLQCVHTDRKRERYRD